MRNQKIVRSLVFLIVGSICSLPAFSKDIKVKANAYTLNTFVEESLNKYSEIKLANFNINRLALETNKVASQLGWVLTSEGGYSRTSSVFGIQSDTVDFGVGLQKRLESGDTFSVTGRYAHSDSEQVLSSLSPNPSDTTNLELSYRIPLLLEGGNQQYFHAVRKAEIEKIISEFDKQQVKENLTLKLIDIFYTVMTIDSRLVTAKKSMQRARQLRRHIKNNINLGLLEKGEILQADSQIFALKLERQKIVDLREKQVVLINRFLQKDLSSHFFVDSHDLYNGKEVLDMDEVISKVKNNSYEIKKLEASSKLLNSALELSRNREKDKLDVIFSIGVQNRSGDSTASSIDDTDTTGMIRLEYRNSLDKRAFSSERLQIQIDLQSNRERLASVLDDLKYDTYNLLNQVNRSKKIVKITEGRYINETRKYNDILKRFRNGRTTTNIVIQFDNDRIRAELDSKTEKYELAKRFSLLKLKQGFFPSSSN